MKQQVKSNSIKDLNDIKRIKEYLRLKNSFNYDRHLLYFILGINTCLKPGDLLELKWCQILNDSYIIRDFIVYNGYRFYLNKNCKEVIYNFINRYDNYKHYQYIFGNNKPFKIQTINIFLGKIEKELQLSYNLSASSLHKTFVYWQIVNYHYDHVKMSKLRYLMYKTNRDKDINVYAEYNIDDDMIYINDINL